MITHRPTINRLPRKVASMVFAALLVLVLPLAAQRSAHGGGGGGGSHGSGGGGGHTAHGVPGGGGSSGGGQRQPGGHGGHGGHGGYYGGHGGYYHGHGYYPYYYPYWGWPSLSFYWGYPYYYGYPYGYGYGYGYGYYDGDGYGYDGGGGGGPMGALDLDVSPGNTHVFVNGQDLGEVDKYDGWPGYLWLPRGTYDVAFYLDGYKTIARQITIYPGNVIDIDDRMEQGQSTRPEDLVSKSHERRDARIQYERQRSEQIDRQGGYDDENWQNRVRQDRQGHGHANGPAGPQGHLRLSVQPDDASVYLDGQFVGTGTDLSQLRGGLAVGPGTHHLAVVRPGHKATEKEFTVQSGEDVQLDIALEAGGSR